VPVARAFLSVVAAALLGIACAPASASSGGPAAAHIGAGGSNASLDHRGTARELSWPPEESWIAPPTPLQPPDPSLVFPTPTPAPAPDSLHHPASSPFKVLARGYDASWPQCAAGKKPAAASYGIIGINGGKAFTLNPCFLELMKAAPKDAGIYLNTGFNAKNAPRLLPYCATKAAQLAGATPTQQLAYGLGCSTTVDTLRVMSDFAIPYPSIWWLDVEETNSWDDGDPSVNRYSILAQIDQLAATGKTVAVYSDFPDWKQITGGLWGDPRIAGNWVAGKSPQDACSHPGFSGAPVWLAQELATWPGSGYDSDYAC
jgi:hypothetical protein